MKKTIILAVLTFFIAGNANSMDLRPSIGMDYAFSSADIKNQLASFAKKYHSGSINAGLKFNDYVGIETFYQKSSQEKKNNYSGMLKTKADFYAYGLDLVGFYPTYQKKVDLIGSLGVGWYDLKAKAKAPALGIRTSSSEDGIGFRFGLGAQYNITENWGIRGQGRYVLTEGADYINGIWEASLGFRYTF